MDTNENGSDHLNIVSAFSAKLQKYYSWLILVILKQMSGKNFHATITWNFCNLFIIKPKHLRVLFWIWAYWATFYKEIQLLLESTSFLIEFCHWKPQKLFTALQDFVNTITWFSPHKSPALWSSKDFTLWSIHIVVKVAWVHWNLGFNYLLSILSLGMWDYIHFLKIPCMHRNLNSLSINTRTE